MNQNNDLGINRTGITIAPQRTQEMLAGMEEFPPTSTGSSLDVAAVRIQYAQEAEPAGSVPIPSGVMNKIKTGVKVIQGADPILFMDKLGERLAFERAGTRLYEALVSKHQAFGDFDGGPTQADLQHIFEEEYQHFTMLQQTIEQLGGDPTAVTPSANLHAVMSQGINAVIVDPRITLLQSLEAILLAELADNACWEALVELAHNAGEDELASQFEQALTNEQEHLAKVQSWLAAGQGRRQDGNNIVQGKLH